MPRHLTRAERLLRTMLVVAGVVVALVVWVVSSSSASSPSATSSTSETVPPTSAVPTTTLPKSPLGVGLMQVTVTEPTRKLCIPMTTTCVVRNYQLQIYYPAITSGPTPMPSASPAKFEAPFPVLLFAHGFDLVPADYLPLISKWVSAGFLVAAPIFPLSSSDSLQEHGVQLSDVAEADAYEGDILNQPGDLSAAINELTTLNTAGAGSLSNLMNLSEIAAAGQSDGGDTVLAATANTCCIDPRIKVALILSGAAFPAFPGIFYSALPIPTLVVQGSADTVNPPAASQQIYSSLKGIKYYLNLIGADHLQPYTSVDPYEEQVVKISIAFLEEYLLGRTVGQSEILALGNLPGVSQVTAG
ncbi:MAG: hypothetical protein HKL82_02965 [Acidimicrobiaceae bacterium]|nr:hypothetical protein [Acidimicrobiaceae bacterium]